MALIEVNWQPSRRDLRVFALGAVAFCAAAAWFIARRGQAGSAAVAILGAGAVAGGIGLVWPAILRPVYRLWMVAAYPIGWTVSHLVMAVLFFLVITPIGLMIRACGRDPMQRRFDRSARTYWKPRADDRDTRRYFRQF
jgi:hypothetical protein